MDCSTPGCGEPVRHSAHDKGMPVRHSTRDKGHEEGGSAYAKAGSSLRSPPGYSRAFSPKKPESAYFIALCSHLWLYWGLSPTTISLSLCQRVNLQLQLIKFLGVTGVFWLTDPSDGSLTCLTGLPALLQLCIRLFTVSQERHGKLKIFK